MSEADWWLCPRCSSLNNLSASKCYSCRGRKPRESMRASEKLGYVPVISWDGKVTLQPSKQYEVEHEIHAVAETAATRTAPNLPPLREPIPRDILEVAPRPPDPARITYRLDEPPRPAGLPAFPPPPLPGTAPPPPPVGAVPPPMPGGHAASAGPRPLVPVGPGPVHGEPRPGLRPADSGLVPDGPELVAVGPGLVAAPDDGAAMWPHWRDLLDVPTPKAERLRESSHEEAFKARQEGPVFNVRPPADEGTAQAEAEEGRAAAAANDDTGWSEVSEEAPEAHEGTSGPTAPEAEETAWTARNSIPWPEADLRGRQPQEAETETAASSQVANQRS